MAVAVQKTREDAKFEESGVRDKDHLKVSR